MNNSRIERTTHEAKKWVEKYPFLRFKDNSCCPCQNTDEMESCWIFDLPDGWINTCAKDMCDELLEVLGPFVDDFVILQLKEKYNEIVLYWCWEDRDYTDQEMCEHNRMYRMIKRILSKYAKISYNTCIICGEHATKWSYGWIASFCNECYEEMVNRN